MVNLLIALLLGGLSYSVAQPPTGVIVVPKPRPGQTSAVMGCPKIVCGENTPIVDGAVIESVRPTAGELR